MIEEWYFVYDSDLDYVNSFQSRSEAEAQAEERATSNEVMHGVFLKVPVGGTDMPELRAVTVYDEEGREVFSTHAYDAELVPA